MIMGYNSKSKTQIFGAGVKNGNKSRMIGAKIYMRRNLVCAQLLQHPVTLHHEWGVQHLKPGDFLIIDPGNDKVTTGCWGCERSTFIATYTPVPDTVGFYRKTARVRAVQMDEPFIVQSLDSEIAETGHPGDWLVENIRDDVRDRYLIEKSKFEAIYEIDHDHPDSG